MGRNASVAKVICFNCRESTCACVAQHNVARLADPAQQPRLTQAVAWLGGACVAGGALGAAIAMLLGG